MTVATGEFDWELEPEEPLPTEDRRLGRFRKPLRVVSAALIALLVVAMAVTPLSATFRPAYFDLRLQARNDFDYPIAVTLKDDTGMVAGFAEAPFQRPSTSGPTRSLIVEWQGDTDSNGIWMHFYAVNGGYRLDEITTAGRSRPIGVGTGRTFALILRAPVDAASVEVDGD